MHVLVKCMHGIGDNIYARPFIKRLVEDGHEVYIKTPLPFIFGDLSVSFIEVEKTFRAQTKYLKEIGSKFTYVNTPNNIDKIVDYFYDSQSMKRHGIVTHMEESFGYEPGSSDIKFDLPNNLQKHGVILPTDKKIAIIRPVTHRREWLCVSRSPKVNYISWCSRILTDMGWHVISIADCSPGEDWIEEDGDTIAHQKFHNGELNLEQTLSLIKDSHIAIGGSGFIVPAAIAAQINLFIIFGGRGKYDNPHKILDLRMDMRKIGWALPTNFCRCSSSLHECDKEIKDLDSQFFRFMRDVQFNR
jgi:hypothetical protein